MSERRVELPVDFFTTCDGFALSVAAETGFSYSTSAGPLDSTAYSFIGVDYNKIKPVLDRDDGIFSSDKTYEVNLHFNGPMVRIRRFGLTFTSQRDLDAYLDMLND